MMTTATMLNAEPTARMLDPPANLQERLPLAFAAAPRVFGQRHERSANGRAIPPVSAYLAAMCASR
jgi:hypothetical protein